MREIFLIGFQFLTLCYAFGHGDLHERIAAMTEKIADDPSNPQLYFKRGHLYQQHGEPDSALVDYLKAEAIGYNDKLLFFRQAEIYLELEFYQRGINCANKYLKEDPHDIKIHRLRGELFIGNGDYDSAISAFQFVIKKTKNLAVSQTGLRPENFLQLCQAYINKDLNLVDSALMVIEVGLSVLGDKVFFLHLKKLEYLKIQGDVEKIICQYDYFIDSSQRKEKWYYRKGKYFFNINNYTEALENLKYASLSCQNLPLRIQNTKATILLVEGIDILINKINAHEALPKTKLD